MPVTYNLAPMPRWYFADLTGKPLGAGSMYTFSSLNPGAEKAVFMDIGGVNAWPNPVLFNENGSQGPFYWAFDDSDPDDTYYIEVYDVDGQLVFTIDHYFPPSGGGGNVVTTTNVQNLITNNIMWRNFNNSNPATSIFMKIAPGAHQGFAQTPSNAGPDICFIKNNTNATDTLQFNNFSPLGTTPFLPSRDVTPAQYLNYTCTNSPSNELFKFVQFPITANIQNLINQPVVITIWAQCISGSNTLSLQWFQFFGDGAGATPPLTPPIATINNIPNTWTRYVITTAVPDIPNAPPVILGGCNNSGLFIRVGYPLGSPTNINFTKLGMWLGNSAPALDYQTYDMIEAVIDTPRTGDVIQTFDIRSTHTPGITPGGYILMNDLTIGSPTSGAHYSSSILNIFPLYNLLWNNVSQPSANTFCIVSGGLGVSAIADFTANKQMQLPKALGRAIMAAGNGAGLSNHILGSTFRNSETINLTIGQMPAHNHPGSQVTTRFPAAAGIFPLQGGSPSTGNSPVNVASQGNGDPINILPPNIYANYYIKL